MGKICYIMGKSSSGKDTIFKRLREELKTFRTIILYTTRPMRAEEANGREYHYVNERELSDLESEGRVIELRAYNTKCGVWKYFTVDDGQIDLAKYNYLVIGTLESYREMSSYFGADKLIPVYIEVDDGMRLARALDRERLQDKPKYDEMCRRFLADSEDFSEENLRKAGIEKKFQNVEIDVCVEEIIIYIKENVSKHV